MACKVWVIYFYLLKRVSILYLCLDFERPLIRLVGLGLSGDNAIPMDVGGITSK